MKHHILLGVCLFSLFAASCSNDDQTDQATQKGKAITINAYINHGTNTRLTFEDKNDADGLKVDWSTDETFKLYQGTSTEYSILSKSGNNNSFKGFLPAESTGKYYAVYGNGKRVGDNLQVFIGNQSGTIDEDSLRTLMVAESEGLPTTLTFNHKLAYLKLNLFIPEGTGKVSSVVLSGLTNYADVNLFTNDLPYKKIGDIRANNGGKGFDISEDHKTTVYLAVFPELVEAGALTIKANCGNNTFSYTIKNEKQLTAGVMTPANLNLELTAIKEHDFVDLGLPSHTLWATCNVGAYSNKPERSGDYYAWGETEEKSDYSWSYYLNTLTSSSDCGTDKDPLKDYVLNNKSIAGTQFDVARVKWGDNWCMPTAEQFVELFNSDNTKIEVQNTDTYFTYANLKITSLHNGNSIILPYKGCGYKDGNATKDNDASGYYYGYYWSATPGTSSQAKSLKIGYSIRSHMQYDRYRGQSVRPVIKINVSTTPPVMGYDTTDDEGWK